MPTLPQSVRARTTLWAALVVGVSLVAASWGLLVTLEHSLVSNRDDLSRARAVDIAGQAASGSLPRLLSDIGDDSVGQVVDTSGHVLAESSSLGRFRPISLFAPPERSAAVVTMHGIPDDNQTEDYRVWALRASTSHGPVTVYVGNSLESVSEAVSTLRRSLFVGIPLMLVLLALGTRVLIGRALRPVEAIRTRVESISDADLDRRVPVPASSDEVARLAATMNDMLARLETASRRQREFVADASHELQSPLAAFRTQLEVAQVHPGGVDWEHLCADLLAGSDQMERLVRDLLFLAREDAGDYAAGVEPVDLDDVVLEEVSRLQAYHPVRIDTSQVSAAPLRGRRDDLSRLVRNVLENAVRHARSRVLVTLGADGCEAQLSIADDGPGVPADQRDRVFERFARVEGSRTRSGGGTGLGLSIAKVIAERHRGSIAFLAPHSDVPGACFAIRLPLDIDMPAT